MFANMLSFQIVSLCSLIDCIQRVSYRCCHEVWQDELQKFSYLKIFNLPEFYQVF